MALMDALTAEIDQKLSRQIDEIVHHREFQKLESSWRGLKFVIDRVNFRENAKVEMLNVSKEDLRMDFEDTPEVPKSGMCKIVHSGEYGGFGGRPCGVIVGNYDFGPGPQDIHLLQHCATVAAMSHAPFIAAAGPKFFGLDDFLSLPEIANGTDTNSRRAREVSLGQRRVRFCNARRGQLCQVSLVSQHHRPDVGRLGC